MRAGLAPLLSGAVRTPLGWLSMASPGPYSWAWGPSPGRDPKPSWAAAQGPLQVPGAVPLHCPYLHGPLPAHAVPLASLARGPEVPGGSELSSSEAPLAVSLLSHLWPVLPAFTLKALLCVLSSTLVVTSGWLVWSQVVCLALTWGPACEETEKIQRASYLSIHPSIHPVNISWARVAHHGLPVVERPAPSKWSAGHESPA